MFGWRLQECLSGNLQQLSEKKIRKCSFYQTTSAFARTANMPGFRQVLKRLILLLWTIVYCASCSPLPQTCIQCSLSCDGAPELKKLESVIVSIKPPLQEEHEEVYTMSSLYNGEHCSVPGCFHRDTPYVLKIYANNSETVSVALLDKTNVQPVCDPEGMSDRKNPNDAEGKKSNKLLIPLAFGFWLIFHLKGPR